jgi:hypothetical protein
VRVIQTKTVVLQKEPVLFYSTNNFNPFAAHYFSLLS